MKMNTLGATIVTTTLLASLSLMTSCKDKARTALETKELAPEELGRLMQELGDSILDEVGSNRFKMDCLEKNDSIIVTKKMENGLKVITVESEKGLLNSHDIVNGLRSFIDLRRAMKSFKAG